jgi:hypothetical protein
MSRFKLLLLSALALLVLGVAASSASADPAVQETTKCKNETAGVTTLCIATTTGLWAQLVAGEWEFDSVIDEGTTSLLNITNGPDVDCTVANDTFVGDTTATLTATLNVLKIVIEFSSCKVTNSKATEEDCVVEEPIKAKAEGTVSAVENDVTFAQVGTEPFATITVKSAAGKTCSVPLSKGKVTGSVLCEWESLASIQTDAATHLLICKEANSKLEILAKAAKFSIEELILLVKGNEWALTNE